MVELWGTAMLAGFSASKSDYYFPSVTAGIIISVDEVRDFVLLALPSSGFWGKGSVVLQGGCTCRTTGCRYIVTPEVQH